MNIIVGSHVWIEDPDISWVDGQVSKITGQDAEIETTNGKKVLYVLLIFTLTLLKCCKVYTRKRQILNICDSILDISRLLQSYQKYYPKIWKLQLGEWMI